MIRTLATAAPLLRRATTKICSRGGVTPIVRCLSCGDGKRYFTTPATTRTTTSPTIATTTAALSAASIGASLFQQRRAHSSSAPQPSEAAAPIVTIVNDVPSLAALQSVAQRALALAASLATPEDDDESQFPTAIRLAVHCQGPPGNRTGVHRFGSIDWMALQFEPPVVGPMDIPGATFLVDLTAVSIQAESTSILRDLLEHASILKVTHDCRLSSDGLSHIPSLAIQLANVHDTCAWHATLTKNRNVSLQAVMKACGLPAPLFSQTQTIGTDDDNGSSTTTTTPYDADDGDENTPSAVARAAVRGVQSLLHVATIQDERLQNVTKRTEASRQSNRIFCSQIRSLQAAADLRLDHLTERQVQKKFYGRENKEFNDMVTRTFTFLYEQSHDASWICYYKHELSLMQVKDRMGYPDMEVEPLPPARKKVVRQKKMKASKRAEVQAKKAARKEKKAAERLLMTVADPVTA